MECMNLFMNGHFSCLIELYLPFVIHLLILDISKNIFSYQGPWGKIFSNGGLLFNVSKDPEHEKV